MTRRAMIVALLAATLVATPARASRDAVLYRVSREAGDASVYDLWNLVAQALAYGLVTNGARTGLGHEAETGPRLTTESLYYQALRIYSYFDWEFRRALVAEPDSGALPASLVVLAGRFPASALASRQDEGRDELAKLERLWRILAPERAPVAFRRLGADDLRLDPGARTAVIDDRLRAALWDATAAALSVLSARAYAPDASPVRDKLEAMLTAYAPLATLFHAGFERGPAVGYTRLVAFLPAFHTLEADDADHPESWFLTKGLARTELPHPVQISIAELTHLSYLEDADAADAQAIQLELRRDLDEPDRVTSVVSFGALRPGLTDEPLSLDTSDYRNTLYVRYRVHLASGEDDNALVCWVKDQLNGALGRFEIDARIHELTLHLVRRSHGSFAEDAEADELLRPQFSLAGSKSRFAHRRTDDVVERAALVAAGFVCEPAAHGDHHCWQDFWSWDHFMEQFVSGRVVPGVSDSRLGRMYQSLISRIVGFATQQVLDRSIPDIENAIDRELARLVNEALDRVSTARETLTSRLHTGLFQP